MHEQLWAGVDLNVGHSAFFLQEMSRSLQPPEQTATNAALMSSGAVVGNLWQQSFYARVDAFLAMSRRYSLSAQGLIQQLYVVVSRELLSPGNTQNQPVSRYNGVLSLWLAGTAASALSASA